MIKESGIVERLKRAADPFWYHTRDEVIQEAATLIAELQAGEKQSEDRIQRLQAALAFWMPGVSELVETETNGYAGDSACLLYGFNGDGPSVSWGDKILDRALAAESSLHRVRGETLELCRMFVEEECYLDQQPHGISQRAVHRVGHAIRDRINCSLRSLVPPAVADTNADAPGNVGLVRGISSDQTSLNKTGLDTGAVKTAESSHSPSTLNVETE